MSIVYNTFTIEMMYPSLVYLGAIFFGAFIRAVAPFIRKMYQNEDMKWDHWYTLTFIVSYIVSWLVAIFQYNAFPIMEGQDPVIIGFLLGLSSDALITEFMAWFKPDET